MAAASQLSAIERKAQPRSVSEVGWSVGLDEAANAEKNPGV